MNGLKDEHYRVQILRCPRSGIAAEERWETPDGRLHRLDGPALVTRDRVSGQTTSLLFLKNGEYHRSDGEPAHLEFDERSGVCVFRAFFVDGRSERPEGLPHVERIDPDTGVVYQAEYWARQPDWAAPRRHRSDGPAVITFDPVTGERTGEKFYLNGRKRRSPPDAEPPPELDM